MKVHRDQIQNIKSDLEDPAHNQAKDMIQAENKIALLIANEKFDKEYIGMPNLPPVNDDLKNILQTVGMLHIPEENIHAYKNIKYDKMKSILNHISHIVCARTRRLKSNTGIGDSLHNWHLQGVDWIRLRDNAMKENASFDNAIVSIIFIFKPKIQIDLSQKEQKDIK